MNVSYVHLVLYITTLGCLDGDCLRPKNVLFSKSQVRIPQKSTILLFSQPIQVFAQTLIGPHQGTIGLVPRVSRYLTWISTWRSVCSSGFRLWLRWEGKMRQNAVEIVAMMSLWRPKIHYIALCCQQQQRRPLYRSGNIRTTAPGRVGACLKWKAAKADL